MILKLVEASHTIAGVYKKLQQRVKSKQLRGDVKVPSL